jgi:hypothetical protein
MPILAVEKHQCRDDIKTFVDVINADEKRI